jgi:hypothetical protein
MKPLWQGVLLGVVAYLFFVVATAPAVKILSFVQPEGIRFAGTAGSVWSVSAALVAVSPVQLTDVRWSFRPFSLFVGQLEFAVEGQLQGQRVEAHAGSSLLGKPYVSDVRGRVAANDLLNLACWASPMSLMCVDVSPRMICSICWGWTSYSWQACWNLILPT